MIFNFTCWRQFSAMKIECVIATSFRLREIRFSTLRIRLRVILYLQSSRIAYAWYKKCYKIANSLRTYRIPSFRDYILFGNYSLILFYFTFLECSYIDCLVIIIIKNTVNALKTVGKVSSNLQREI